MRLNARPKLVIDRKAFEQMGEGFAQDLADELARRTAQLAKLNVSPYSGPGPHPHRPESEHEDTAALQESISIRQEKWRWLPHASIVYTDLEYGLFLEVGWTNPYTRNHWRYPWLGPAMSQATQEWAGIARASGDRWFSKTGTTFARRIGIASPLSATWEPETPSDWQVAP